MTDLRASLEEYRGAREALEAAVLPLATSVDGRRFIFQVSLHGLDLEPGGYVAIEVDGATRLGQLLSLDLRHQDADALDLGQVRVRAGGGDGVVLHGDERPFHDALVRPATADEVGAWLEATVPIGAQLDVGELALARGVPFASMPAASAATPSCVANRARARPIRSGVLLERLLIETDLRVVVLDPNSDYVRLGEPRVDDERYRAAAESVQVRGDPGGSAPIRVRFRDLSPAHQAGLLRLDPLADRAEYGELLDLLEDDSIHSLEDLAESPAENLKLRARNLGVDRFEIWPGAEGESLLDEVVDPAGPRCTVVDLGSLGTRDEQTLTAGAVLERLWRERGRRQPVAIVIDEAQNVCPAEAADPLTALATADAIRIAGEGRKFGLYLIVVTQRPQKIHENVLSQCDNLALMRMNSVADLAHVGGVFSFVPPGLLERATTFGQGEALVAGKVASHPALVSLRIALQP